MVKVSFCYYGTHKSFQEPLDINSGMDVQVCSNCSTTKEYFHRVHLLCMFQMIVISTNNT